MKVINRKRKQQILGQMERVMKSETKVKTLR